MHCPSINFFGTFFPSWMLAAIAGVVATALFHKVIAAVGLKAEVKPPILVYPSLGFAAAFLIWLVGYGS